MYFWIFPPVQNVETGKKTVLKKKLPVLMDIRDRTITAALLQRVLMKMGQDTVAKFYMSSKYSQECVESLCQPTFSKYTVARQSEHKLIQMNLWSIRFLEKGLPDLDDWNYLLEKSQIVLENHKENLKDLNLADGPCNPFRRIYEEQYREQKRRVWLLEQVVKNFNLMKKEKSRSRVE